MAYGLHFGILFHVIKYFLQESKSVMCGIVMNVGVCLWGGRRFFHLISLTYQEGVFARLAL